MKNINRNKGFSLIEVLISISIVALIAISTLTLFGSGLRNINNSKDQSLELFEVQAQIEQNSTNTPNTKKVSVDVNGSKYEFSIDIYKVEGDEGTNILYFNYID